MIYNLTWEGVLFLSSFANARAELLPFFNKKITR
jgi:hypothetical protein